MSPFLLVLALACADTPSADRAAYLEVISQRRPEAAALTRCASISDADLAGDCALVVANRTVAAGEPAESWCPEVPAGPWQDECWFQAAELDRKAGRAESALAHCDAAGAFRDPCLFHLWQEQITLLHRDAADLDLARQRGERILQRWEERLGPDYRPRDPSLPLGVASQGDSLAELFWTRFYKQHLEPMAVPEALDCPPAHQAWCRAGLRDVVLRRALDWRRRGGSCQDLPNEPMSAQAWWSERGVAWLGAPDLAEDLAVACD